MTALQCISGRPCLASRTAVPAARRNCTVAAAAVPNKTYEPLTRRTAAGLLVALPALLGASAAIATPENNSPAEKRKNALKATAQSIKETGEDKDTFPESGYTVGEDKSPNVHTRQEEGMRKS